MEVRFLNKNKPETTKNIILKNTDEVSKFDFSVYGNINAGECQAGVRLYRVPLEKP